VSLCCPRQRYGAVNARRAIQPHPAPTPQGKCNSSTPSSRSPQVSRLVSICTPTPMLFEGIWFFVRRSCHNSCAAAFERYRTEGCEGVLIYVYAVESLKNEKKTEVLLAFKLRRVRSEMAPQTDSSTSSDTVRTQRIGPLAGIERTTDASYSANFQQFAQKGLICTSERAVARKIVLPCDQSTILEQLKRSFVYDSSNRTSAFLISEQESAILPSSVPNSSSSHTSLSEILSPAR